MADEVVDIVTVNVALAAFSLLVVTLLILNAGPLSSSFIVIVTDWVPFSVADPPFTVSIAIIPVSLPSKVLSSVGVKDAVPVVAPAAIVMSETVA